MIVAALLALSAPQVAVPPSMDEEEIVVMGRLRKVRFDFRAKDGVMSRCRVTRSTGDAILDRLVCDTARACVSDGQVTTTPQMAACMKARRDEILDQRAALAGAAPTELNNASN